MRYLFLLLLIPSLAFSQVRVSGMLTSSGVTLGLSSGGLATLKGEKSFPFYLDIRTSDNRKIECVQATAQAGVDSITITRGCDYTFARTWNDSEIVELHSSIMTFDGSPMVLTDSVSTSATTGVMSVSMTTSIITITPTGSATFNATGGIAGQLVTFFVTTLGTTSFTLTFGTNFKSISTLATGIVTAKTFSVTFRYSGATWIEISRTIGM